MKKHLIFLIFKEENVENSHRNLMSEQREYIEKRKEVLKHKEKELNEREAKIIKIVEIKVNRYCLKPIRKQK